MMPRFIQSYYNSYHTLFLKYWNHMTPIQYCSMLILIAVVGWLSMKGVRKR